MPSLPAPSPLLHPEPLANTVIRGLWGALTAVCVVNDLGPLSPRTETGRWESPGRRCPREMGDGASVTGAGSWRSLLGTPWAPSVWSQEAGHSHHGGAHGRAPAGPAGFSCRTEGTGVSGDPTVPGLGRTPGRSAWVWAPSPGGHRAHPVSLGSPGPVPGDTWKPGVVWSGVIGSTSCHSHSHSVECPAHPPAACWPWEKCRAQAGSSHDACAWVSLPSVPWPGRLPSTRVSCPPPPFLVLDPSCLSLSSAMDFPV